MTITAISSGSEETASRKTAENTVKHRDGGVGSVVAIIAVAVKVRWS